MTMTLASRGTKRSNLDGGRPVHPSILHLEGHVEEITALDDDADALEHIVTLQTQIGRVLARLTVDAEKRVGRLRDHIIPEVRACYSAAEETVGARA
jgi:hypothetical protein